MGNAGQNSPQRTQGALFLPAHPVDIMFIKFYFSFKGKIMPSNYVPLTSQFIRDPLTDRVPIISTDPGP